MCSICLCSLFENMEDDDGGGTDRARGGGLKCGPICGHVFHSACIEGWISQVRKAKRTIKFSCPICKSSSKQSGAIPLFLDIKPVSSVTRSSSTTENEEGGNENITDAERRPAAGLVRAAVDLKFAQLRVEEFQQKLKECEHLNEFLNEQARISKRDAFSSSRELAKERKERRESEAEKSEWRRKLLKKDKECRELYLRLEKYAARAYADTCDLDDLKRTLSASRQNGGGSSQALRCLVDTLHRSNLLQKQQRAKLYTENCKLKGKITILQRDSHVMNTSA
eukprot:g4994.t1